VLRMVKRSEEFYFAGKLIRSGDQAIAMDRLASVRYRRHVGTGSVERHDYYPYGEEKPGASGQERDKFATYHRDATGLDYADQRYFTSQWGRFVTVDPQNVISARSEPRSWNAYTYADSDPINLMDPAGLSACTTVVQHGFLYVICDRGSTVTITSTSSGGGSGGGGASSREATPHVDGVPDVQDTDGRGNGDDDGGGGGEPPGPRQQISPYLLNQLKVALKNERCLNAIGAASAGEAIGKLENTAIIGAPLGVVKAIPQLNGLYTIATPPIAQAQIGGDTIQYNYNVWSSLTASPIHRAANEAGNLVFPLQVVGSHNFVNEFQATALSAGYTANITPIHVQFVAIAHEISHTLGYKESGIDSLSIIGTCLPEGI